MSTSELHLSFGDNIGIGQHEFVHINIYVVKKIQYHASLMNTRCFFEVGQQTHCNNSTSPNI